MKFLKVNFLSHLCSCHYDLKTVSLSQNVDSQALFLCNVLEMSLRFLPNVFSVLAQPV